MGSKPIFIVIGGPPATGKTKLAERIQAHTGFRHISKDQLKEHLFDVLEYRDREWSRELGSLTFPLFVGIVEMYLSRGESVVVDNPFVYKDDWIWFESLVERFDANILQIHLTANPVVLRERFIQRAGSTRHPGHNDALDQVMSEFEKKWFNKTFIPVPCPGKTKIVDTTDFSCVDHDEILDWINKCICGFPDENHFSS